MKALLGRKIGMTQIFADTGEVIPVTVIEAAPGTVTQIKTVETDGYDAVQVGFEDQKPQRVNKPMTGHFEKAGVAPKKNLVEFQAEEGEVYEVGQTISVADFEAGKKNWTLQELPKVRERRATLNATDITEDLWDTVPNTRDFTVHWQVLLTRVAYLKATRVREEWVAKL